MSHVIQVPRTDITSDMTSFRLQNLQPYTTYVIQMRCKQFNVPEGQGYWSEWSVNTTKRTPEDREYYDCCDQCLTTKYNMSET